MFKLKSMNRVEALKFIVAYSIHPKNHNNGFFSTIFIDIAGWKDDIIHLVNEKSI